MSKKKVSEEGAVPDAVLPETAVPISTTDLVYKERDACIAALAHACKGLGYPVWMGKHDPGDPLWEKDWMNIVFIRLPAGQVTWHVHDSQMLLFAGIEPGDEPWDGHDTVEKYRRLAQFTGKRIAL